MKPLKEISLLALLAAFYFASVYFAVAALAQPLALRAGFIAAVIAMVIFLVLVVTRRDEPGLPLALLILTPVICIAAGIAWWILRLLFGVRFVE